MITVLFKDYHVEMPPTSVKVQLITAMKIGLQRISASHGPQTFSGLRVLLNGNRMHPSQSEQFLEDGSIISLIPVPVERMQTEDVFILDL